MTVLSTVRVGKAARAKQLEALASMLAGGGNVVFLRGSRPEDPDANVPLGAVMARIPVSSGQVKTDALAAVVGPVDGTIERPGKVEWFRLLASDGHVMIDGTVGLTPAPGAKRTADLTLTRVEFLAGDLIKDVEIALTEPMEAGA